MSRVFLTLRNHWKKSVFFSCAGTYAVHRAHVKYREDNMMEALCREARKYGEAPVHHSTPLPKVTVILNPAADKGKARKKYEKYCAPILHLAGMKVHVVRTEAEGQAKDMLEVLSADGSDDGRMPDAVLVAGGDGTVMEAVTGFMRRADADKIRTRLPLGILPVGETNKLAKCLFPDVSTSLSDAELMARSSLSCVRQLRRPVDVLQVENVGSDEAFKGKRIYGLSEVQMGAFRDAHDRLSKYWYWAGLRKLMAYVFGFTTAAKMHLWTCNCDLEYAVQGGGGGRGEEVGDMPQAQDDTSSWWWWNFLLPSRDVAKKSESEVNPPPATLDWKEIKDFQGVELLASTPNVSLDGTQEKRDELEIVLGPDGVGFSDFVGEGWRREKGRSARWDSEKEEKGWRRFTAQALRVKPREDFGREGEGETYFYLDRENVEMRGDVELTLLPERLVMFCSEVVTAAVKEEEEKEEEERKNKKWWQQGATRQTKAAPLVAAARNRL